MNKTYLISIFFLLCFSQVFSLNSLFVSPNGKGTELLSIINLQFSASNWTLPNRDGIIATQAVQGKGYPGSSETGIIQVEFVRNLSILHCNISGSGNHGIVFSKGVQESQISFCHIDQVSANSIVIDTYKKKFPPDSLLYVNNRVADNLIENYGMHYTNGMGLIASCVAGLVVENNEIRFGRYFGMQIGNHYGDNLSGMRDNLIQRNNNKSTRGFDSILTEIL